MEYNINLPKLHPAQEQMCHHGKRFNVCKCGRRLGKTEASKELTIQPMLDGKYVGYFVPTYKDLDRVWQEIKLTLADVISHKNEQLKTIDLITGGRLEMWSIEEPDSGKGRSYHRAIIDECEKAPQKNLKYAWEITIRPTLMDFEGDAWFMSTPKFGRTYFKDVLYKMQDKYPDEWKSFTYTCYDNPYLPKTEIDAARKIDEKTFRCEYLCEDVNVVDSPWAYAYDASKHISPITLMPTNNQILYLSFDFNRNPICCSVIQHHDGCIYVIETISLENSDIYKMCDQILVKYRGYSYMVTGDASGNNKSAMVQDNMNYYRIIMNKLDIGMGQIAVPTFNPKLEQNQVLVNSLLQNYKLQLDPDRCQPLIFDLENVQMTEDGKINKDSRNDLTQRADAIDTLRYYMNMFHWDFIGGGEPEFTI